MIGTENGGRSGQSANIAKLIKINTGHGKTTEEDHGDFYFSFLVTVTKP